MLARLTPTNTVARQFRPTRSGDDKYVVFEPVDPVSPYSDYVLTTC
jgi:hypothetical protein